jgi:hypothetical protein
VKNRHHPTRPTWIINLLATLTISTTALAGEPDNDGCWDGYHEDGGSCVEMVTDDSGNRLELTFTNRCDDRLYLTWCVSEKCGTDGLRGGQSKRKKVYSDTSYAKVWAVGSERRSKDSVCKDKMGRW